MWGFTSPLGGGEWSRANWAHFPIVEQHVGITRRALLGKFTGALLALAGAGVVSSLGSTPEALARKKHKKHKLSNTDHKNEHHHKDE